MQKQIRRFVSTVALSVTMAAVAPIHAAPPKWGDVNETRVLTQAATGNDWLVTGGDFGSNHYSPLQAISAQNAGKLGLAWSLDVDSPMGMANEPLVVDGTIYITTSLDRVIAIEAVTGKVLWKFDPHVRLTVMRNSWAARTNRGVAVWEGKVFLGTGDCRILALDAATGRQMWESPICVDTKQTGTTGAPRAGGGLVYIGYNGSDTGVRGSVAAFDANTGKLAWRFWNVPGDPSKPQESKALEMASKTWKGNNWWQVGGGDCWDPITYDASTGLLIYATAGATPEALYGDRADMKVEGERLFASSIVAVNAKTGEYAWHYHTDSHTENFNVVVTDLEIDGVKRHVAISITRTGVIYIVDAKTGHLVSQKSLAEGVQALRSDASEQDFRFTGIGFNWWPMSHSAATGLIYIPAYDSTKGSGGFGKTGGRLIAWDPVSRAARWFHREQLPINGGVLSTAGNLVFLGEGTGEFEALDAQSGRKVWSIQTGSAIQSVPVTFTVNNEQYVLIPVGLGSASRLFDAVSAMATPQSKRGPSRLYAFKLNGSTPFPYPKITVPPVPQPPEQKASAQTIKAGEGVFDKFMCGDCHSPKADGTGAWILDGAIPDLRYMPRDVHDQFLGIVLGGARRMNGMPGFGPGNDFPLQKTAMTPEDAEALHAYIVELQWRAFRSDKQSSNTQKQ
jgi:quinohemoprotein ethanol dehydrogenase